MLPNTTGMFSPRLSSTRTVAAVVHEEEANVMAEPQLSPVPVQQDDEDNEQSDHVINIVQIL